MAGEGYNPYGFRCKDAEAAGRITLPAAASQTWVKGDALALDSNTTGSVSVGAAADTALIGIAGDDRTSTSAGDDVPVVACKRDDILIGPADADPSGLSCGSQIDLVGSSGAQMFDVGSSATDVFTFLKISEVPGQSTSAQYALLECVITETKHGLC